jgi:hypothetical protein
MKTTIIILTYLALITLASCHKTVEYKDTEKFSFEDFKIATQLNATAIQFDEPIMKPHLIVLSDSILIVQNLFTEKLIYAYNISTKKKIGEYVWFGSGPNELLRIKSIQLVGSDLYIMDNQIKRIYKYDVGDFHKQAPVIPREKTSINDFFSAVAYTGNGYVATTVGMDNNRRLTFFNTKGEKEFTAGSFPDNGEALSPIEKMEGFLSSIAVNIQQNRIYLFGMNTDLIEIYDLQGKCIKSLHGPEHFFPAVREKNAGNGYSKAVAGTGSKFAYINPLVIDDEIYVAYSGNLLKRDEEITPINHILVFDKDGNPVRRYELSEPIARFAIDTKTNDIYATSNIPEYHMIVFKPLKHEQSGANL